MKTIALLHTVPSVLATFPNDLREALAGEELLIHNTMDEFLASDANINGFTQANLNRLLFILKAIELETPDLIVVTCSTLGPGVEKIKPFISTPIIVIDDAMTTKAVSLGQRITIMATARSTVAPTREKLIGRANGKALEITELVCDDAYTAIKKMDKTTHDRLLKEAAAAIKGQEVIVLAQASMGHLEEDIAKITGSETLSSPKLCFEQIKKTLY